MQRRYTHFLSLPLKCEKSLKGVGEITDELFTDVETEKFRKQTIPPERMHMTLFLFNFESKNEVDRCCRAIEKCQASLTDHLPIKVNLNEIDTFNEGTVIYLSTTSSNDMRNMRKIYDIIEKKLLENNVITSPQEWENPHLTIWKCGWRERYKIKKFLQFLKFNVFSGKLNKKIALRRLDRKEEEEEKKKKSKENICRFDRVSLCRMGEGSSRVISDGYYSEKTIVFPPLRSPI
ncbi:hypothetical protein SNEBB_000595 [Seison nebaliae]|nr:hypothetical protein SNEBB_000595 [Seison nebaliae]